MMDIWVVFAFSEKASKNLRVDKKLPHGLTKAVVSFYIFYSSGEVF